MRVGGNRTRNRRPFFLDQFRRTIMLVVRLGGGHSHAWLKVEMAWILCMRGGKTYDDVTYYRIRKSIIIIRHTYIPTADVGPVIVRSVGASFLRVTENKLNRTIYILEYSVQKKTIKF